MSQEKKSFFQARFSIPSRDDKIREAVGATLKAMGFRILSVSTRGMIIEGTQNQFEECFDTQLEIDGENAKFKTSPQIPDAVPCKDALVYFPTKPEYGGKGSLEETIDNVRHSTSSSSTKKQTR